MRLKIFAILALMSVGAFAQQRAVFGKITDTEGNPLAGVAISLETLQSPADGKKTKSDKKGRYAFRDFKPGDIVITFVLDGYMQREITYRTSEQKGRDKKDVVMYKEGEGAVSDANSVEIKGVVYDTKGNPLAGVKVVGSVEGTPFTNETVTDDNGFYSLRGMMNNENQLRGSLKEYRDQIVKVKVREREVDLSDPTEFVMETLDEAYARLGMERPKEEQPTPEEEAVELFNLAVEPYQQGSYQQAEDFAVKALEKDPNQMAALKLLIHSNLKLKDWDDVLKYSEMYLKQKPDDTNIMQAAREAAERTNQKDKVASFKAQLKDKGVINKDSLWGDAVAALNNNDDASAVKIIEEILKMDPNDARAYFELGKVKVREYEFEEAVKYLKKYMGMAKKSDKYYNEAKELVLTLSE